MRSSRAPGNGCRRPALNRAAGGTTTSAGSPSAAVRTGRARANSARPRWLRWPARPAPMSSRAEISLAKNGKDLVTMSQTPIAQQAEAAATRINQLTERMLTAARNAGGGLADAHEKALRSLVANPADLNHPLQRHQPLPHAHTKSPTQ